MYSESIITCSWSQVEIQMEEFFSVAVRTCPCPVSPSFVPINGTLSLGSLIPFLTVGRKHVCLWGYEDLPGQPELKLTGLNNIHLIIFSLWTHFFLFVTIAESFIRGRCGKCAAFEHREKEELNNFSYGGGLHQISPKCGGGEQWGAAVVQVQIRNSSRWSSVGVLVTVVPVSFTAHTLNQPLSNVQRSVSRSGLADYCFIFR